jgi:aspartate aminotransferase-like enzyme
VPLQCDESKDFMTFRIGLFGLEKLHDPARSVQHLTRALDEMGYATVEKREAVTV